MDKGLTGAFPLGQKNGPDTYNEIIEGEV